MSDRELLEMVAKAVGINRHHIDEKGVWYSTHHMHGSVYCWNPLTDDGAALRLAVKLGLVINCESGNVRQYERRNPILFVEIADESFDINAATRRAIVRAAAEIGKAMP